MGPGSVFRVGILAAAESKVTFGVDGLLKYELFGQELWITNTHVALLLVVLTLAVFSIFANRAIRKADPNRCRERSSISLSTW